MTGIILFTLTVIAALFWGGVILLAGAGILAVSAWAIFWGIVLTALGGCFVLWFIWWLFDPKAASEAYREAEAAEAQRRAEKAAKTKGAH